MKTLSQQSRPVQAGEITFTSMPPETILLNLNNGYYFSINEIGAAIWNSCDGIKTIEEITGELSAQYDAPQDEIRDDVAKFVEDMIREGLLSI